MLLPGVIGDDLLRFGKLPLCLFICIIITAITVVTTAHHTRLLTAQREQLVLERDALDIEWRNLILEENALGDHSRVERIATEAADAARRSITRKYRCTEIRIIATHESSAENAKSKTSGRTGQLYQLAFCVAVRLYSAGAGLPAGRVARLQVISPDMLVRQGTCVLCACRRSPPRAA